MSKVTIASAVLAGVSIGDRLSELEVPLDQKLFDSVGGLATSLAAVMATTQLVNECVNLAIGEIQRGNLSDALEGLTLIANVTADLVSDQDKIDAAMGVSAEEKALIQLLGALGIR